MLSVTGSALLIVLVLTLPAWGWANTSVNRAKTDQRPAGDEIRFTQEMFLKVVLNGEVIAQQAFVALDAEGRYYLSRPDIKRFRLKRERMPPLVRKDGIDYLPLSALTADFVHEALTETLHIRLSALDLETHRLDIANPDLPDRFLMPQHGGNLNYSVHAALDEQSKLTPSLAFEPVVYSGPGFFRSSFLHSDQNGLNRLNTTLILDNLERRQSLVIGDNATRSDGTWGRATPFLGVSWGSNFDLDPRYSPYANFSFFGTNDLPSVLEMISEGTVLSRLEVPPGPLEINNLPTPNASGNLTIKVTDIQGKERFYETPYLKVGRLYAEGVYDYNVSGGVIRQESTRAWGDYGGWIGTTTHRYGISSTLTAGAHLDMSENVQAIGLTFLHALPQYNLLSNSTVAASRSLAGRGSFFAGTLTPINRPRWISLSGGFNYQSQDFSLYEAWTPTQRVPTKWSFNIALGLPGIGLPLGLSYSHRTLWDGTSTKTTTVNYNTTLFSRLHLCASFQHSTEPANWMASLNLAMPLDARRLVSMQAQTDKSEATSSQLDVSQGVPYDRGVGYRLSTRTHQLTRDAVTMVSGALEGKASSGQGSLFFQENRGRFSGNAHMNGSIGVLDGKVFLAPSLDAPFALVRTGDAVDLPIYRGYNRVSNTNSRGWAIVPQLAAFQKNVISFKPEELDFTVSMDGIPQEQVFAPFSRGGVVVDFPLKKTSSALVVLVNSEGSPLPSGAEVTVQETGEKAFITLNGQVFLTGMAEAVTLQVNAGRFGRCLVRVPKTGPADVQPSIGPLVCPLR